MTRRILLLFATLVEAASTIDLLGAQRDPSDQYYTWKDGKIVICGIGCLNAAVFTARFSGDCSALWNLGAAGSLNDKHAIGQVVEIGKVVRNPILPDCTDTHSTNIHREIFPAITLNGQGPTLISSDYPIFHPDLKERLKLHGDLVDMEGYGVMTAAGQLPCRLWKAISDFTDARGPKMLQENLKRVSDALATKVGQELLLY